MVSSALPVNLQTLACLPLCLSFYLLIASKECRIFGVHAQVRPGDTWLCIFFNLPFSFPWAPGRPLISQSQNSQLNVHKIPRLLVMTLFVPAPFLLMRNVSMEGDNCGMNQCLFGSQTAEPGAVETLSPFCGGFSVVPWTTWPPGTSHCRAPQMPRQGGQGTWWLSCPFLGQS